MQYKDTLNNITAKCSKISYPEAIHLMIEIKPDFLSYFYIAYTYDIEIGFEIEEVDIDSLAPEFVLFGVEPLSEVLDKFILECLESQ